MRLAIVAILSGKEDRGFYSLDDISHCAPTRLLFVIGG